MTHKLIIFVIAAMVLFSGCAQTNNNNEQYKKQLAKTYPVYDFQEQALVDMRYPTLEELTQRAEGDVSFIIASKVTPLESVTFQYSYTENDEGQKAIDGKLAAQGIAAGNVTIYPYEIEADDVYGGKDIDGKVVMFISQYVSRVPEIEGVMGILVSSGEDVPALWVEEYEKRYPEAAADTYVYLLHSELSYYYITDSNEVVPMCDRNEDDYERFLGMKLDEFEKMLK